MTDRITTGFVYVAHARGTNRIKIGFSKTPHIRRKGMQTGSPFPLSILATWPGSRQTEDLLHRALAEYRREGEWFEVPPFIGQLIWRVVNGRPVQVSGSAAQPSSLLIPFPSLGSIGRPYWFEVRRLKDGGAKIVCRWREGAGKRNAACGRWSADAVRGLPDNPEAARQLIIATAEAYRIGRGIKPGGQS